MILCGEIKSSINLDQKTIETIVRETVKDIGYTNKEDNFYYSNLLIVNLINQQSEEINKAVSVNGGAGDQGAMFGYATNETPCYMPLQFILSRNLALQLNKIRENKILPFLKPDGKTQLTMTYDEKGNLYYIDSIVISCHHSNVVKNNKNFSDDIIKYVISPVIPIKFINVKTKFYINPAGSFIQGGPCFDTGLTGRKIIQDSYGSEIRHGGGCFSGKDASKVDRSGAYMLRYLAKNIVASGICDKCELQIAYVIGVNFPVGLFINTFNTNRVNDNLILDTIYNNFDLSPQGIINQLNLTKPIFHMTAKYGHFGVDNDKFSWEKTDKIKLFSRLLKKF
ncbi:methionine adenosyltransferase [Candidatus Phytoplasma fabacearum]|uniref:methionine adenosyltransferase n=1 Tax=Candidatus Phytoplasma fabacearum TaxID=2982628 RepID=UPI002A4E1044|nr:methionine adenosyltransferase ['Bituminaria bituminosa' little leaf phytoplasma]